MFPPTVTTAHFVALVSDDTIRIANFIPRFHFHYDCLSSLFHTQQNDIYIKGNWYVRKKPSKYPRALPPTSRGMTNVGTHKRRLSRNVFMARDTDGSTSYERLC